MHCLETTKILSLDKHAIRSLWKTEIEKLNCKRLGMRFATIIKWRILLGLKQYLWGITNELLYRKQTDGECNGDNVKRSIIRTVCWSILELN